MASRASTPRSRSSTGSSASSDTTMHDAPPLTPVRPRPASRGNTTASAHKAPSDPTFSLLLNLPRELRDRIYTFALVSPFPIWWPAPSSPKHGIALGLLTTSRQIHSEAAPILYSQNKFLFIHPSDCNIFRVISSPYSENITSVYLRIREKDVTLWNKYLGSKSAERSMKADLPKLKNLWIFLRCVPLSRIAALGGAGGPMGGGPTGLAAQVQAAQNALAGPIQALQQQVQNHIQALQHQFHVAMGHVDTTGGQGTTAQAAMHIPAPIANPQQPIPFAQFAQGGFQHHPHPPPPPPHAHGPQNNVPPPPPAHPQQPAPGQHIPPQAAHPHLQHGFYASCLRWEREMGLEGLCLSLQDTRPVDADIKIVCIMKLLKPEVQRLIRLFPDELWPDRNGDARTRFRRVHGLDVCLEVSGYEVSG